MDNVVAKQIDINLRIKSAFVSQIKEQKKVSVIWRRRKKELESKSAEIDPETSSARIDDVFKMKTSLDFDQQEYKFLSKVTVLELVFESTKAKIGHYDLDLAEYTNRARDKMQRITLDLKSNDFPGSQIDILISIQLLDQLPERKQAGWRPDIQSLKSTFTDNSQQAEVIKFDAQKQSFEMQRDELNEKIKVLEELRVSLEQEKERLDFYLQQGEIDKSNNFRELLKAKTASVKKIKSQIDLYGKRYQIIIQVLDTINKAENKNLFDEDENELVRKTEASKKEWELKKEATKRFKKLKDNFSDFDYYATYC